MTGPFQIMPSLSDDDFGALKADIAERGVLVPVEYDEQGNVLDGHHRIRACEELGISEWPKLIRGGLTEEEKRVHARQLNLARRHLNQAQKRELIAGQIKETPEKSNNQIAKGLGVDDKTVGAVREALVSNSEIPNNTERREASGRKARGRKPGQKKTTKYVSGTSPKKADANKAENEAAREQARAALPEAVKAQEQAKADAIAAQKQKPADVGALEAEIEQARETIAVLEAEVARLKAENKQFSEMRAEWEKGGFEEVIRGKDETLHAAESRIAAESAEKVRNLNSFNWAMKKLRELGYTRNAIIDLETGEVTNG